MPAEVLATMGGSDLLAADTDHQLMHEPQLAFMS